LPGTIIVEKQTDPDGAPDSFTFSGDASGSIKDDEQIVVSGLAPGAYTSQETVPAGWELTNIICDDDNSTVSLADFRANFQLEAGETVKCTFYNRLPLDYGDAPDSYGTLLASNGARHAIVQGHHLGPVVDTEPDGQPSPLADGDDLNPPGAPDDEDGVTLPPALTAGDPAATVTVDGGPSGGMLDAWIDFDGSGVFDHPAEHLWSGTSQSLNPGPNNLTFAVPAGAVPGPTYARFRLSNNGGLPPTGFAPDGEVEDYWVQIEAPPQPGAIIVEKQTDPDGVTDSFTFSGDASGSIKDGEQIVVGNLQPGTYTSQEVVPPAWKLTSILCDDSNSSGDLNTRTATFQLEAGETVKCTFTNSQKPTAISLVSFEVEANDGRAMVMWETGTEMDNAGFNLYRSVSVDGPWTKINPSLIVAEGDPLSGASYTFADMPGRGTFYYRLEDVDYFGLSTLHTPVLAELGEAIRAPWFRPWMPEF
jgi:hypothetical protein